MGKIAIGDNQASFLGAVGDKGDAALINMGTGGQISLLTDQYLEVPGIETRPLSNGRYLLIGASLCGGRAYAVLEKFFRTYVSALGLEEQAQYEVMQTLARAGMEQTKADALGEEKKLQVCTTFAGTRQNPSQRGSIQGIGESNFTPELLTYGVLTGMSEELYDMYVKMLDAGCKKADRFMASGNGVRRNPVLQDIIREMFDAGVMLSLYEEEAACGAALL